MAKIKTTYELDHQDVAMIICEWFAKEGVVVAQDQLKFQLTEARANEGYGGYGPDQKARIDRVWFEQ